MSGVLDPFRFVLIAIAGWMNQHQLQVIDYLREENRVLREQLGGRLCVDNRSSNHEINGLSGVPHGRPIRCCTMLQP
jgi:hypothetical protein